MIIKITLTTLFFDRIVREISQERIPSELMDKEVVLGVREIAYHFSSTKSFNAVVARTAYP